MTNCTYVTYDPPLFMEQKVFSVETAQQDAFLTAEYTYYSLPQSQMDGFMGKEIWASVNRPDELYLTIFWKNEPCFTAARDALSGCQTMLLSQFPHPITPVENDWDYQKIQVSTYNPPETDGPFKRHMGTPSAVLEELVMTVNDGMMDGYLTHDHAIWTSFLASTPAYQGKSMWLSPDRPNEAYCVVFWDNLEEWKAISLDDLIKTDEKMYAILGEGTFRITGEHHTTNLKRRIEYFNRED